MCMQKLKKKKKKKKKKNYIKTIQVSERKPNAEGLTDSEGKNYLVAGYKNTTIPCLIYEINQINEENTDNKLSTFRCY